MDNEQTPRRVRADATRNRSQILEVASLAFKEEGLDVSMDSIAKRAGVGPGTLYRHFPTRDALLADLLLEEHYDRLMQVRVDITQSERDPARALEQWLEALSDWMNAYDGLPEPLRAAWMQPNSPLGPTCESLAVATEAFLKTAQAAGRARPSLSGRDLFLSALAMAWATSASGADRAAGTLIDVLKHGWAAGPNHSDGHRDTRPDEAVAARCADDTSRLRDE